MIEHALKQTKGSTRDTFSCDNPESTFMETIERNISKFHAMSRQGLWNIAAFMLISIGALLVRHVNMLELAPEPLRVILGAPPAPFLIHTILAVSTVSALIIISGRIVNGSEPGRRWEQLVYRAVFYLFYLLSNVLSEYFTVVFAAGMAVLLLEHYHIWAFFAKAIRHERELMRKISLWPLTATSQR